MVWLLLEARTQPRLCEIAKTRGFWEKGQRPTKKEMEGQHTGRHEEIPADWKTWHNIENTGRLKYWPALHKEIVKKDEKGEKDNYQKGVYNITFITLKKDLTKSHFTGTSRFLVTMVVKAPVPRWGIVLGVNTNQEKWHRRRMVLNLFLKKSGVRIISTAREN